MVALLPIHPAPAMSSRASTSRVSLEDWDSLAPLSNAENASVSRVQAAATEKPMPPRVRPPPLLTESGIPSGLCTDTDNRCYLPHL